MVQLSCLALIGWVLCSLAVVSPRSVASVGSFVEGGSMHL